ncbi:MAG: ATP-dependent zinc protease [Marinobacter sp.]|uniref:ATP-dependent zinc protease family protein n=1 Tax=Marinobacter sp. TaxID=50741 RepID=UPI00396ED16A
MRFLPTVLLMLSLAVTSAVAEEKTDTEDSVPEALGFVEWVVMKDTRLRLKARLDTGAKTSSLHAVNVEEFTRNEERWVSFEIPLGDHEDQPTEGEFAHDDVVMVLERPVRRTVLIKRKGAPSQRRYVVDLEFCIAGTMHTTQFSLTDRGKFSYPVLLGRRFMRDDNILVDSSDSFIAGKECEYSTLEELAEEQQAKLVR